jgi:hypothetical protein
MSTAVPYGGERWTHVPGMSNVVVPDWAQAVTVLEPGTPATWLDALMVAVGTCQGTYQPRPARGVFLRNNGRTAFDVVFHWSRQ